MNDLIESAWKCYRSIQGDFIVKPSIPILYFGDRDKYLKSSLRIVTVGLNPSKIEFPQKAIFSRFISAENINLELVDNNEESRIQYLNSLNSYFRIDPYKKWFKFYEKVLNGLDCSYYDINENTALHIDIFSVLATNPTWSECKIEYQAKLSVYGIDLWHKLILNLSPNIIILSIAHEHLKRIRFHKIQDWISISHEIIGIEKDYNIDLGIFEIQPHNKCLIFW